MKWFKHLSGSLNNSIISESIERFGGDGYMVFFGILEMVSDEFDIHNPGILTLRMKKITKNLQLSRQKTVKILRFFDEKAKTNTSKDVSFLADIGKVDVTINCKRLAGLCDNHTKKLLKDTTKPLQSKNEVTSPQEVEVEVRSKKENNKYSDQFEKFWESYPVKKSKAKAYQVWKKLKPDVGICLSAIQSQDIEKAFLNAEGKFCPEWKHPATWLGQQCWEDETEDPQLYKDAKTYLEKSEDLFLKHCKYNALEPDEVRVWIQKHST